MAKQEFFIDESSKALCESSEQVDKETVQHILTLPPAFKIERDMVICVESDSFCMKQGLLDRVFSYNVDCFGISKPFRLTIEDGLHCLPERLQNYVFNSDAFCISLAWETGNDINSSEIYFFIFYKSNESAMIRYNGLSWQPVGPASVIQVTLDYSNGLTFSSQHYSVSYNGYELPGVYGCNLRREDELFCYEDFGINWLTNALIYREEQLK